MIATDVDRRSALWERHEFVCSARLELAQHIGQLAQANILSRAEIKALLGRPRVGTNVYQRIDNVFDEVEIAALFS